MTDANISAAVALSSLLLFLLFLLWPERVDGRDIGNFHVFMFYATAAVAILGGVATLILYLMGK